MAVPYIYIYRSLWLELDNWPDSVPQLVGALRQNCRATGSIPAKDLKLHFLIAAVLVRSTNKMYINFHSIISSNNTLQSIIQPTIYDSLFFYSEYSMCYTII